MRGVCVALCGLGVAVGGLTAPDALATTGGAVAPFPTGTTVTPTENAPTENPPLTTEGTTGSATENPSTGLYPTPGTTTESSATAPKSTTPAKPSTPHAPVTAKTPKLSYKGPVYEKTAMGQLVHYVSPAATSTAAKHKEDATGGAQAVASSLTEFKLELVVPGKSARLLPNGLAAAPMSAPLQVQEIVWSANQIVGLPYIYGGGHNATFVSPGYDCSGTVSYALHGADLLTAPLDSSEFMRWGESGIGLWVTIFTNPGHAYVDVAGLRLDTSSADDPSNLQGPRWRPLRQSNAGYSVRHPEGL